MAHIALDDVWKVFPDGTEAVRGVSLDIADGELVVLVGPSGCGKTTLLRMVAGLDTVSRGTIRIGGRIVNGVSPKDRDIAMVFQNYALYPHMTVHDNMAFGLKLARLPRSEIEARVLEAAQILGLDELLDRKPASLSGGQRQRVAMGRAIVRQPQAFLMDEPLSNLDAKLRVQMRSEILRLQQRLGATTVYVTHDQTEAMTLGERVAVIRRGALQQVAPPQELYDRPTNLFVAGFIGSPPMNLLQARLVRRGSGWAVDLGDVTIPVPPAVLAERPALRSFAGTDVIVGIRPEDMEDAALVGDPAAPRMRSAVELREALGSDVVVHVAMAAVPAFNDDVRELAADVSHEALRRAEQAAAAQEAHVVARLDPRTRVRQGDRIELVVDAARMHFFDAADGTSIGTDRGASQTAVDPAA
jgi:multiple sugar transport system ATP-binding protein